MQLSDLFIGYSDGKNEAINRINFDESFFNYNNIYNKVLQNDKFLVLGRKGTGKTILGEYIKKRAKPEGDWFCEKVSYKRFKFQELFTLKTKEIKPNEYSAIWEWLLLLQLASMCVNDETAEFKSKRIIEKFLKSNYFGFRLDMNKVVEETRKNSINAKVLFEIFSISGSQENTEKFQNGTYLDYLPQLKNVLTEALSESQARYTIILDELDDQFRNEVIYKSNIISLIKVIDKLNYEFLDMGINVKFIALLRSDIFYVLNDSDLNKIEQDNAVKINWGTSSSKDAPLMKMMLMKMRPSVESLTGKKYTNDELYNFLFPEKVKVGNQKYEAAEFLLGRTYFRPRDLISFLNCVVESFSEEHNFSARSLKGASKNYSEYLLKEIKNELFGHYPENVIEESLLLLRQFKKKSFSFDEIYSYFNENKSDYANIDLKESLKFLFDFGVIGNTWRDNYGTYHSWAHRENTTIDYNKKFCIHMGLRKVLNIS